MTQTVNTSEVRPMCVTAFIAPKSLISLPVYSEGAPSAEYEPPVIAVGTYLSNRAIVNISYFHNAEKAMKYAFVLKAENCPISKNAFALLQAEVKRAKEAAQKEQEKKAVEIIKEATLPISNCNLLSKQYEEMKAKHPDAVLLFRCGDFYECFGEDAVICADILQITLTRRMNGDEKSIELAGFPHHALDTYLPKLVRAGKRVAICEQLEEPKAKKVTKKAKKTKAA